ncbi:MAG: Fic/DOC family N-terminal domain-containing protein [Bacteroidales bacterium]|nr:Fic/DOC family N-terminal domain-containing protein [Bacteroidales bacterium]
MQFERALPFNQLPFLPPGEDKIYSREVMLMLAKAHRSLGKLDGISKKLPNALMLVNTISLQEAKSSSEIENIFTTDDELYKAISTSDREISPAAKEVLKYRESLWSGIDQIRNKGNIDRETTLNIYQNIKQTKTGIRSEHSNVRIVKGGDSIGSGEVIYTPPKGDKIIDDLLKNFFAFINDDEKYDLDPLLKMAISHYQFEAIHPFTDGNGRTGRILNILLLISKGLLSQPILYLSKYIINNKDSYYHYLNGVSSRGDWERWLLFMLTAVNETANFTILKIEEISQQFEDTRAHIEKYFPRFNYTVIEAIFTQPYIKAIHIVSENIKSRNTARKYLDQLCGIQVLELRHIGTENVYINNDLVRILEST